MSLSSQISWLNDNNGARSRPARVGAKEAGGIQARIAAVRTKADLKNLLHRDGGLSRSDADKIVAALVAEEDAPVPKAAELSEAGVAREFRGLRERDAARRKFLFEMIDEREARAIAAKMPKRVVGAYCDGVTPLYEDSACHEWGVRDRLAGELAAELDECKDAGALEAKLVRLGWNDEAIDGYLDQFGPE